MEAEASVFETSEAVAATLASTPLLRESWRLCSAANSVAPMGFVTDQPDGPGGVGYLAFSGVQMADALTDPQWARMVPLDDATIFGPLVGPASAADEEASPAAIHAGLLHIFMSMLHSQTFINQILALKESSKAIVITGHSLGGSTASLAALWLLSQQHMQNASSSFPPLLCITFGSPLIGNASLTRSILRERWSANFCHVVAQHDLLPRLLFSPDSTLSPTTRLLLHHWHPATPGGPHSAAPALPPPDVAAVEELFGTVVAALEKCSSSEEVEEVEEEEEGESLSSFRPFGNYLMCSKEGAVCIDDVACVVKMMYLTMVSGFTDFDDHVKYGEYVGSICMNYLNKGISEVRGTTYEAGLAMALRSTGISSQEPEAAKAKECLVAARRLGLMPILNCAKLSISLSQVVPFRAQIEWFMARCDESDNQMGYYDEFKSTSSKMRNKVNMHRIRLAIFWDMVIEKLENNELPHDFQKRDKWVNTFHFYKLLAEPLDIAEYYRSERHLIEGHYLANGRPRRFKISDIWWSERSVGDRRHRPRTRFASQTQDSCFWARLEEAKEWLARLCYGDCDESMRREIWGNVKKFDDYAKSLVEKREVSKDVVAKNSSYSKWTEELKRLSSQLVYPYPQSN